MSRAKRNAALDAVDRATRRRSQEAFEGAVIVEAGAGTGKTSILVARIVVWALGEGWHRAEARAEASPAPHPLADAAAADAGSAGATDAELDDIAADVMGRIAAITFTEAAAAEMAERTGSMLSGIAEGVVPESVFEDRLPSPIDLRCARARALIGALDRLQVRTIHAFCRGVLAQYPLEAGVHPGFQVDAEALVQAEIVREVVEAAVVAAYGESEDSDLMALAVDGFGPAEIEEALLALVASRSPVDLFDADPLTSDRIVALVSDLDAALTELRTEEGGRFAHGSRMEVAVAVREAAEATAREVQAGAIANVESLEVLVESIRDRWSEKLRKRLSDWRKGEFTKSESAALNDAVDEMQRCAAALAGLVDHFRALAPMRLGRARRALGPLLRQAREELRRRGAATFDSLLRDARDLLVNRPDACSRLRNELDQLLVDEFQDTDPLQCEIVHAIALEGPAEARPGLFLVGDPKQSIYGWRNADLGAYDDFLKSVLGDDGEPDRLSRNFRSLPGILDAVEDAIAPVMQRKIRLQPAFQPLIAHHEEPAHGAPCVEHWVTWEWDAQNGEPVAPTAARAAELEAVAIARDLRRRHAAGTLEWNQVGILFRSLGDLETYLQAFRTSGIPYAVERDRSYYRRREIIEASALVRSVLDRNDQVALLAWLRSASVGVPDAALLPLWRGDFPRLVADLHEPDADALAGLDAAVASVVAEMPAGIPGIERVEGWEESLRDALRTLAELRTSFESEVADVFVAKLRSLSLLEATESARFLGEYRVANLDRFFRDLLAELEADCDRETLLRRLRSGVAQSLEAEEARPKSADDAVRVMTIHKAKGLDFTHTYVVQLHKRAGGRNAPIPAAAVGAYGGRLEYQLFGASTLNFHAVSVQQSRVADAERVRTLYVAMTRARDRLVLVGNWPTGPRAIDLEVAETHIDLLTFRKSGVPDLAARMREAALAGAEDSAIEAGASWVFPVLHVEPDETSRTEDRSIELPGADALREALERERMARADAEVRSKRRWNTTPSADSHVERREEEAESGFGLAPGPAPPDGSEPGRVTARVAGTVVHRILEDFDFMADPVAELARQRERVPHLVAAQVGGREATGAASRAKEILDRMGRGSLLERLHELGEHVVARELSVLLPPASDDRGAVGFVAGSIDLCYRDPDTDEWVIADYKTDRIEDAAEFAARAASYTEQGRYYSRALREALELDAEPRFELWFVDADRVEVVTRQSGV